MQLKQLFAAIAFQFCLIFSVSLATADEPMKLHDITGDWHVTALESRGRADSGVSFAGMRYRFAKDTWTTWTGKTTPAGLSGKPPLKVKYTIDDTHRPRQINMVLETGEGKRTMPAIYKIESGKLYICMGREDRPKVFATDGTKNLCYVAERTKSDEPRTSAIGLFESTQQNDDYRVTLLGVTKGVAFLDSQVLVAGGGRSHGKNVVPWMRVTTVIEKLTNKNELQGFAAETDDGTEFVGEIDTEINGNVAGGRASGTEEMDLNSPPLRGAIFPAEKPNGTSPKTKVFLYTLSGKIPESDTVTFRFSFGAEGDRRELVFKNVPMP